MKDFSTRPAGEDINARLAARVRGLRAAGGLTRADLAGRSQVSRSMLSLIERGESSPTAVLLDKIAAGLGIPLASLFEAASAVPAPVSHARDRTPWRDPQSGYIRSNVSPPGYRAPFQIVEVQLPPGGRVAYESAMREAGFHQQVWVQQGDLIVTQGTAHHRLGRGDCLAMEVRERTTFRNPGRSVVRYVVVVATQRDPAAGS